MLERKPLAEKPKEAIVQHFTVDSSFVWTQQGQQQNYVYAMDKRRETKITMRRESAVVERVAFFWPSSLFVWIMSMD